MIETLEGIDRAIVLTVNGWNSPLLDSCMWYISKTAVWIPFYAALIYLVFRHLGWKRALVFVGMAFLLVGLVDSSTTYLFKETIQRYRPSHHLWLVDKLHFHQFPDGSFYQGGDFGFFSSHASNNAAIGLFSWMILKSFYPKLKWFLLGGVALICFSRLYLAVHYLTDLLAGALWGMLWGYAFYRLFVYFTTQKRT